MGTVSPALTPPRRESLCVSPSGYKRERRERGGERRTFRRGEQGLGLGPECLGSRSGSLWGVPALALQLRPSQTETYQTKKVQSSGSFGVVVVSVTPFVEGVRIPSPGSRLRTPPSRRRTPHLVVPVPSPSRSTILVGIGRSVHQWTPTPRTSPDLDSPRISLPSVPRRLSSKTGCRQAPRRPSTNQWTPLEYQDP